LFPRPRRSINQMSTSSLRNGVCAESGRERHWEGCRPKAVAMRCIETSRGALRLAMRCIETSNLA
jgi:hypothetical protein